MGKLLLLVVLLGVLVLRFRHLFRVLDFAQILRVNRRQWRWIRRNKLVPYFFLFVAMVVILVGGAIYHIMETTRHFQP